MHVALVSRWYPPKSYGGVATYNYYLAHALVSSGHQVTVITARRSYDELAYENDKGVKIHRVKGYFYYRASRLPVLGRYIRELHQLQYSIQLARKIKEIEVSDPIDIIEFAEINAEGWAYLQTTNRTKVVVRCHTPTFVLRKHYLPEEMPYDTRLTSAMERFCVRHADALTTPSNDMAQTMSKEYDIPLDRFVIIPNIIDTDQFNSQPEPPPRTADQSELMATVLHVGRLERVKGIEVLAKAAAAVCNTNSLVEFVFIGGDLRDPEGDSWHQKLHDQFSQLDLLAKIHLIGKVDFETLKRWYCNADVAVVPSLNYESFSYTCAEAMAAGLPVVASSIGGIPETVEDGVSGILFPTGKDEELANALITLLEDSDLRHKMGLAAKERARTKFDVDVVAPQILSHYQSVLNP